MQARDFLGQMAPRPLSFSTCISLRVHALPDPLHFHLGQNTASGCSIIEQILADHWLATAPPWALRYPVEQRLSLPNVRDRLF